VDGACCNLLRTGFGESVLDDGKSKKKKKKNHKHLLLAPEAPKPVGVSVVGTG
jgi:hypothetical protein